MVKSDHGNGAHGRILVAGSLAFDFIMGFPGRFQEHILPEKLHIINLSFLVDRMRKQRGGCAGNIGYTLAMLGEKPRLVAAAGGGAAANPGRAGDRPGCLQSAGQRLSDRRHQG